MRGPRFASFREGVFSLVPSVLVVGLVVTLGFVFVLVAVVFPLVLRSQKDVFCTVDDPVYQTIRANAQSWVDAFAMQSVDSLDFTTADGEAYTVTHLAPDTFFVSIESRDPPTPLGVKGYLYAPDGLPGAFSDYTVTSLEGDIFCYESGF
ncbi:MAG: hypothetical protein H6672_14140 [Anaerolineaceae bacterium]|nr:hypothetical protein [Anaerolineaceae bacterium]